MRKLLTLLLLVIFIPSFGQDEIIKAVTDDNYNFKVVDGNVVWQYVYTTNKAPAEIIDYFKKARLFKVADSDSLSIYGNVEKQTLDYGKYGYSRMNVAMYVSSPLSYDIEIDVKEDKYRVTIKNAIFFSTTNLNMYGVSTNSNAQLTLTEMSYNHKRQKFKAGFFGYNAASALASVFYNTYIIKDYTENSDNW